VGVTVSSKTIRAITEEVAVERDNQEITWGQQNHPSCYGESSRRQFEKQAETWKQINEARVAEGCVTWDGILLEEVFEALAESDDAARRAELIQVAAVAVAEIEAIDRRMSVASEAAVTEATDGLDELAVIASTEDPTAA
jgi:thiosulfate/3-mercaptopyruvate sulfurtransferase